MKLFEKRNIVFILAIFLLFMMVSSVSAADVDDDAVIGNDVAVDTITSTDAPGDTDDVLSAEVISDNPKADPSDSNEPLSDEVITDNSADDSSNANNKNSNEAVDGSSQDVLKASSDDEVLRADIPTPITTIHVGQGDEYQYHDLQSAIELLTDRYTNYEIVIHEGTYTGSNNKNIYVRRQANPADLQYLIIRAAQKEDGSYENVIFDAQNSGRFLIIQSENVHVQGITFMNSNSSSAGNVFDIDSSHFSAEDCKIINSGRDSLVGGAIHIAGSTNWQGQVTRNVTDFNFTNCSFENCIAQVGGVMRTEISAHNVNLINCNFTNNYAKKHGAVTCLYGDGVLIENCIVANNTASSAAGIQMHTANSTIRNTTFIGNNATGTGTGDAYGNGYGGAIGLIYNTTLGATIDGCSFIGSLCC